MLNFLPLLANLSLTPRWSRTTKPPTNGKRECVRRRRQIAAGSLKTANGLVKS